MALQKILAMGAYIFGLIGILLCLIAGLSRLAGHYYLAGFESLTLLNGGMAFMVLGILLKVELIHQKLQG